MDENLLINSVEKFITEKEDYFKKWIFEEPIVISNTHHKKLVKLHEVMYKLITHFVKNFEDFKDQMILSHKTKQIVKRLENIEYKIGTFRTDFVYDDFQQPKLIQITCRFALNSLFVSSIFDSLSTKYYLNNLKDISIINLYKKNLLYISELSRTGDIFILKGKDNKNESVFFKDIFLRTGTKVYEVDINQISQYMNKMNQNSWIVSELTLDEIESLDINLILELSKLNIINDFRTSLFIHDKQFFSVLGNKKLLQ